MQNLKIFEQKVIFELFCCFVFQTSKPTGQPKLNFPKHQEIFIEPVYGKTLIYCLLKDVSTKIWLKFQIYQAAIIYPQ